MSSYRTEPLRPENRNLTVSRLANLAANAIHDAFAAYHDQFKTITRRARIRFEQRDWHGVQADAAARLDLYTAVVNEIVNDIRELLAGRVEEKLVWASMKAVYSGLIAGRDDWELAETFFNSVTRRIFATVGVDPEIEFVDTDYDTPPTQVRPVCQKYGRSADLPALINAILDDYAFSVPYQNRERDATLVAAAIEEKLKAMGALRVITQAEMVRPIFYRGKAAYLVGRLFSGIHVIPLVLALFHREDGVLVDAVLLEENAVSILFSFARSYFHVDVVRPYDLILFLRSIMPRKRVAELYISIGYNKHGKTALYRDIIHHLSYSSEQFQTTVGEKGMVMTVFTMPDYDLVFKIIKDKFAYPKNTTRREVQEKYRLVFKHDRAGRLVDAQEFEHLRFSRAQFSPELLDELREIAGNTVTVCEDDVVIDHAYVERRVTPLNIYISQADENAAAAAVIEYGQAIKDMAATNIFPGDLWLKNFGVTRHGRVVFYDYDELTPLTDCNFRRMPPPRSYEDELSPTPWFSVGPNDIFPEEFSNFLGLQDHLLQVFMAHHADLLDVAFWQKMQEEHSRGRVPHIYPYTQEARLQDGG